MAGAIPSVGVQTAPLMIEHENIQLSLRRHGRIQLSEGSRRRVAGIGHQLLAGSLPFFIQRIENVSGHIHLTPHDQGGGILNHFRNGADGTDILRHVFSNEPVAAGSTHHKTSVLIGQRHGQAVDLGLHGKEDLLFPCLKQGLSGALNKRPQSVKIEHVGQRSHLHHVLHLGKFLRRTASHPVGGRIGPI